MKIAALAFLLFAAPALGLELQVDPAHSTATFAIKHMMVSTVHGNFGKVTGTVNHDPKDRRRAARTSRSIPPASTRASRSATRTSSRPTSSTCRNART